MIEFAKKFKFLIGLVLGFAVALAFCTFAGESPLHVLTVLFESSFGSRYDIGLTLFYTTPLIFCGLAVSIAARAGLFNIGAEGQLQLGTLAAAATGFYLSGVPAPLSWILAAAAALVAGGVWGFIPGWLNVYRGSHEVITTIMLNFIAIALCNWVTLNLIPNPGSQNPETAPVGPSYLFAPHDPIAQFFTDTPASMAFVVAVLLAIFLELWMRKSVLGFEIRVVGQNLEAAEAAGINIKKTKIIAMTLAGALAGLVALAEVLGSAGKYQIGFSPGFGFLGIAVALLANNSPVGVIFSGLLFGALHKGTTSLDLETNNITRDYSSILQAMIILFVSARTLKLFKWPRHG